MKRAERQESPNELDELARRALEGDRASLEQKVVALQGDIFGLALRMLGNRENAEDAAQEILIRIMTRLSRFDFRSRLKTWAYRIAVNYLLDFMKSAGDKRTMRFEQLGADVVAAISSEAPSETERSLFVEEIKIGCTLGMLQCLDPAHRAAYILGEIMEIPGPQAAELLRISPALFRKRLQKARAAIVAFLQNYCGLVSDEAPCRCNRQIPAALRAGRISSSSSREPSTGTSFEEMRVRVRKVEEARRALEVHRSSQPVAASVDFARRLVAVLDAHLVQAGQA